MVLLPVVAILAGEPTEHIGLVRDIGERSFFLYSDLACPEGARIGLMLKFRESIMQCRGQVVRVERHGVDAPVGMAIRLDGSGALRGESVSG